MYADNERLISEYQQGNTALLSELIENNMGLIHTALKGFKWAYGGHPKYDQIISYDDFVNESIFGLANAIKNYDPEQGCFSSYAILHIKQAAYRFYYNNSRCIRVPYEPQKAYKHLRQAENEYIIAYEHNPSTKQLSEFSGVSIDEIMELRRIFSGTISIDSPISGEDESITLKDAIPDHTDYLADSERNMTNAALRKDLERMAKDVLKDDERVKLLFFYFDNLDKMQINEISEACGVPRSSLNRIVSESISKISRKYLDVLINEYSDLFSSGIRRSREIELFRKSIRQSVKLVVSKLVQPGDSITIIDSFSVNSLKESVQATVRTIDPDEGIKVSYIGHDLYTRNYEELEKWILYKSIIDFRTENKKIVEIACTRGVDVVKKLFESFNQELLYMETVQELLNNDRIINNYNHRDSVKKYKRSLENIIIECNEKKYHVIGLIEKLDDPILKDIFYQRYIDRKSHEEIAKEVGYCVTGISKQIRKGIAYLEKLEAIEKIKNIEDS